MIFSLLLAAVAATTSVKVDTALPAGSILVRSIEGDTIKVDIDQRGTNPKKGGWFYWAFRVLDAGGRKLTVKFSTGRSPAVGSRGAAVSFDRGETWEWTDVLDPEAPKEEQTKDHKDQYGFTLKIPEGKNEVWFSQTLPYGLKEWNEFLARHAAERGKIFETSVLCKTRQDREVPLLSIGRLDGKAKYRLFLSSRHHCGEATATICIEGILEAFFAANELGLWLRENVEAWAVPFVDLDGVIAGDQG